MGSKPVLGSSKNPREGAEISEFATHTLFLGKLLNENFFNKYIYLIEEKGITL